MRTLLRGMCVLLVFSVLFTEVSAGLVQVAMDTTAVTVSQQVGIDTTPPTIPTSVTATTISSSQINLLWTASVDDVSLSGYQVFRDMVQVATTSATSYSDTGLTASTTYTYTVTAYDWLGNVSTSSATATATTLQASTVSNVSDAGLIQVRLQNLQITPGQQNVIFKWSTNIYTRYILRWGTTQEYLQGSINSDVLKRNHQTFIGNLSPETTYFYELVAVNQQGFATIITQDTFTTTDIPDRVPPTNVSNLQAVRDGKSVYLSWNTPSEEDFKEVRIVRNYRTYPMDVADGFIVYQGAGTSFLDDDALRLYPAQYYTVFAYDMSGNTSSGAVVTVRLPVNAGSEVEDDFVSDGTGFTLDKNQLPSGIDSLSFTDVTVQQNGKLVPVVDGEAVIEQGIPITFTIAFALLSQQPRVITVSVTDGHRMQTYLLRKDTLNQWYQTTVPALQEVGSYDTVFDIYNYDTQKNITFTGVLRITPQEAEEIADEKLSSLWSHMVAIHYFFLFFLFVVLLLLFYVLWRFIHQQYR